MVKNEKPSESLERRKKLKKEAYGIIDEMEEHQLFGFLLQHKGKRAIPLLVKTWSEVVKPEKKVAPPEDLIELVVKKSDKPSKPKRR